MEFTVRITPNNINTDIDLSDSPNVDTLDVTRAIIKMLGDKYEEIERYGPGLCGINIDVKREK